MQCDNIFYGSFELQLVHRSAKRVLWENPLSLKRSAPKTRQKRSDCFANALPQQQQLQLRGALDLFGWIRGRLTRVDRQTSIKELRLPACSGVAIQPIASMRPDRSLTSRRQSMHVAHDTHARLPVSEQTGAESKIGKAEAQSFLSEANQRSNSTPRCVVAPKRLSLAEVEPNLSCSFYRKVGEPTTAAGNRPRRPRTLHFLCGRGRFG